MYCCCSNVRDSFILVPCSAYPRDAQVAPRSQATLAFFFFYNYLTLVLFHLLFGELLSFFFLPRFCAHTVLPVVVLSVKAEVFARAY